MDEGKGQLNVRHQPESRNGIRMKQTMRKRTKPGERKEKRGERAKVTKAGPSLWRAVQLEWGIRYHWAIGRLII